MRGIAVDEAVVLPTRASPAIELPKTARSVQSAARM